MTGERDGGLIQTAGAAPRIRSVQSSIVIPSAADSPSSRAVPPGRSGARAFTILEILLALAIIALLASVLIGGSAQLLSDKPISADEIFWKTVQEGRKLALKSGLEVRLAFVDDKDKGKEFVLNNGTATQEFPVPAVSGGDLAVSFLTTQKGASSILIAGQLVETQTIPFVAFYADGTCTAFRAQFQRNGASHILSIDPWTCAQVLTPPDPNAPP